jgi:hypothetical protein
MLHSQHFCTRFVTICDKVCKEMVRVSPTEFLELGEKMIYHQPRLGQHARRGRYRAHFGADPWLVSYLWHLIMTHAAQPFPPGLKSKHLLWGLLFLKLYNSEPVNCLVADCNEKHFEVGLDRSRGPCRPWTSRGKWRAPEMSNDISRFVNFLFLVLRRFCLIIGSRTI